MMGAARIVALTGTPGTGKTTLARAFRVHGFAVLDGKRLARDAGAVVGVDRPRRSKIVDPVRVSRFLRTRRETGTLLIDAHWSHEVPGLAGAIVLRLRPRLLQRRLERRRWPRRKVAENVEAEGLGLILAETAARLPRRRIAELDAGGKTAAQLVRRLLPFLKRLDSRLTNLEIGRVDWTADFLEWSSTDTGASSPRS